MTGITEVRETKKTKETDLNYYWMRMIAMVLE